MEPEALLQVNKIKGLMKNWSSVLGKEARRRNRMHLEDVSDQPVDLSGVEAFVNCKEKVRSGPGSDSTDSHRRGSARGVFYLQGSR